MRRRGLDHRAHLFDLYSRQLDQFGVEPPGIFVCPLCREGYSRAALEGNRPSVSLAHVVPKSQGGKLSTLSCTDCNNGNGASLESDLDLRFRYDDWSQGIGAWNARLSGAFGDVGIELQRGESASKWHLSVIPQQSNPAALGALEDWMVAMNANPGANLTWHISWRTRIRARRVEAAIYQSAYLMMFACFGYDFSLNPCYELLRQQVLRPDEAIWTGRISLLSPGEWSSKLGQREGGVMLVREPEPCIAVMLRLRPNRGEERILGVLLPRPDDEGSAPPKIARGGVTGEMVACRPELLTHNPFYFSSLWQFVQSGRVAS